MNGSVIRKKTRDNSKWERPVIVWAVNWWLRSPNSSNNNAYNVNTNGTQNNNNVYNANNACPRPALAYKYAEIE